MCVHMSLEMERIGDGVILLLYLQGSLINLELISSVSVWT